MNFPLEGLHCETGSGVWEAALSVDDALEATDKAALFKTFSKAFFQKNNLIATFMAKWSMDFPGQSGHIHQSLYQNGNNQNIFYDQNKPNNMSDIMEKYVAGQIKYLKPFLSLCAPNINSYTRLIKGFWAPTASTWGVENRTAAHRVIGGSEKAQRVEFRVGAADANPYLAAAAVLGAGLLGIEANLKLPEPIKGNAYAIQDNLPDELQLPSNLQDSIFNLKRSEEAPLLFGKEFIEHFISTREWELREYNRTVNDWQLKRYFEII